MRQLLKGAVELAQTLFPTLFVTSILLLVVEAIWEGSVTPYLNQNYLIIATIIFGAVALWLHRDKIGLEAETEREHLGEAKRIDGFGEKFPRIHNIPVVRCFIRWVYREGWGYSLLLLLILLASFIIRYWYASISNLHLDEGDVLYDANLILQGMTPFKDYVTRAPGYLYTLAPLIKIFGYSIMTGWLIEIIADVIVCFFIFKIGKELYNKNVGLVAAFIYGLAPLVIYNTHNRIIGSSYTPGFVWPTISVYLLLLAIKGNQAKHFLLSGLFIGIAMLFYRGQLTYLILSPLALFYIRPKEFKDLIRNTAYVLLGFCILVVPALAYFVLQTDFQLMLSQYVPPGFITTMSRTTGVGPTMPYLQAKSRELYTLFRGALYLFIPALLFFSLLLKNLIKNRMIFLPVVAGLWAFALFLVVKGRFIEWYVLGQQPMPSNYPLVFFYLLGLLSLLSLLFLANHQFGSGLRRNLNFANTFLILWFFCDSIYFIISPLSSSIRAIPVSIMAAIGILAIFSPQKGRIWNILPDIFLILLILSAVFAGFAYVNTPNPDRSISMSVAREVGQYINERTSPDEKIFAIPMFAVEADRRIVFDISHPLAYISTADDPTGGYDPYDITPSITEIINYLDHHEVKYMAVDFRTKGIFISGRHPELRDYILENYTVEKSIGDVDIYARK